MTIIQFVKVIYLKNLPIDKIEAIDMGRKGIHNEEPE